MIMRNKSNGKVTLNKSNGKVTIENNGGISLVVQGSIFLASLADSMGFIPGWEAKMSHAVQHSQI